MENFEKFVEIPELDILKGIKVRKDTELTFENYFEESGQKVNQSLKDCRLVVNSITNKENKLIETKITIDLLEGDILLFDKNYGYCLPPEDMKVGTIEEAEEVILAKKNMIEKYEEEVKKNEL